MHSQTHKAPAVPVVLYDEAYWRRIVDFEALADEGMVSRAELDLFDYANSPEEAWQALVRRGLRAHTPNGAAT